MFSGLKIIVDLEGVEPKPNMHLYINKLHSTLFYTPMKNPISPTYSIQRPYAMQNYEK